MGRTSTITHCSHSPNGPLLAVVDHAPMTTNTTRKRLLAGGLAAVLATGIGLSVTPAGAQDGSPTTTSVDAAKSPQQGAAKHHRARRLLRKHRKHVASSLAEALDIPAEQLATAMRTVRSERPEGGFDSPQARRTWVQEHLAKALGITVDQLRAAEKTALETRLDEAVESGKLTAERAQEIRERIADRLGS